MTNVTLVTGDGIGPEIAEAARRCVDATDAGINWDVAQAGVEVMEELGTPLPDATFDSIKKTGIALKAPITTPVGKLHDVGLVNARDLLASHLAGVVERESDYALGALDRNRLYGYAASSFYFFLAVSVYPIHQLARVVFALLKLDAGVAVFGVLAHYHKVDIVISAPHALVTLARSQARIQIERLAKMHVDAPKAFSDRRGDGRLQCDPRSFD